MHIVYYYFTESERAVNGLVFGLGSTAVGVWSDVLCVFCACIFVYVSEQGSSVCGGADCKVDHVFFFSVQYVFHIASIDTVIAQTKLVGIVEC